MHGSSRVSPRDQAERASLACQAAFRAEADLESTPWTHPRIADQHLPFVRHSSEVLAALKAFLNSSLTQSFLG